MYDVIIIGAGTAGLTSAIYCLRAGKSVLVIEEKMYGGQIINTPNIENYPGLKRISGYEFAVNLYEQAKDLGMKYVNEKVESIDKLSDKKKVITSKNEYESYAVVIATGVKNRELGLEREKELVGKGISYCATCDGAFFKNKDVAVVGGGNTALEDALFLSGYCNKVYIVHRRDDFRGDEASENKLKEKDNVEFILNSIVEGIVADELVKGIRVLNRLSGDEFEIPVSGIFIAVGQMPYNDAFKDIVELDEDGYVVAGEDCKTSEDGIFVAGDCRTKQIRQLATAAGDGAVAALAACSFI